MHNDLQNSSYVFMAPRGGRKERLLDHHSKDGIYLAVHHIDLYTSGADETVKFVVQDGAIVSRLFKSGHVLGSRRRYNSPEALRRVWGVAGAIVVGL